MPSARYFFKCLKNHFKHSRAITTAATNPTAIQIATSIGASHDAVDRLAAVAASNWNLRRQGDALGAELMSGFTMQMIICCAGGFGFGLLNSLYLRLDWPAFLLALTAYSIVQSVTVAVLFAEKVSS